MGYISVSGTRFAALILGLEISALLLPVVPSPAGAAEAKANVTVSVSNLRNAKGQLMVCLTKNPKAFPDCSKDSAALKKLVPAGNAGNIVFTSVEAGTYAIAIVHDENSNNKMDLRIFIPREGFGFSRNPTITVGPPKFKSASFTVGNSNVTQAVKMKYML
ncbi:MAG: DUF2141 domain-containing protein [Sphingomonadales bacterium]|nr:DUF2141 domain-containing protein [Sphingomonadales bacterium]